MSTFTDFLLTENPCNSYSKGGFSIVFFNDRRVPKTKTFPSFEKADLIWVTDEVLMTGCIRSFLNT